MKIVIKDTVKYFNKIVSSTIFRNIFTAVSMGTYNEEYSEIISKTIKQVPQYLVEIIKYDKYIISYNFIYIKFIFLKVSGFIYLHKYLENSVRL